MASKTSAIRKQLGPLKFHVAKHQKLGTALLKEDVPTGPDELKKYVSTLQLAYDNLSAMYTKLQEKHDEWVVMVQDLQSTEEQDLYDASCDEIMGLLLESDEIMIELKRRRSDGQVDLDRQHQPFLSGANDSLTSHSTSGVAHPAPGFQQGHPSSNAFKAPKIKLPTFGGNYMEFKQFWGIFEANIHRRTDLSNIEKFTYLISQLVGDARRSIAGVLVTDENYEVAVALLKSRFDRADERLVTLLYSEFMRIPVSSRKVEDKQRILDDCEKVFRQLESAGEDVNSNKSLVFGLLSKFPAGMIKDLQRYYNIGPNNTLKEVREGLRKSIFEDETTAGVINDIQAVKLSKDDNSNRRSSQNTHGVGDSQRSNQYSDSMVFHNSTLTTVDRRQRKQFSGGGPLTEPPRSCYFCNEPHFNGDCSKYPTAASRLRRLAQVNRCVRCLRSQKSHDQNERTCRAFIKCVHCRTEGDHSSAVCPLKFAEPVLPAVTNEVPAPQRPQTPGLQLQEPRAPNPVTPQAPGPVAPQAPGPVTPQAPGTHEGPEGNLRDTHSGGITALNHNGVKPALFQTAKATIVNPLTGQQCQARLAMDTMSSRSFVRESIAKTLGLTGKRGDNIYVSVFGTTKSVEIPTSRVEFEVVLRDGQRMPIEANTTKVICQAGAMFNNWTYEESRALSPFQGALADDPYDENGTIDILVGADLVWDFITGPKIQTSAPGLFLIPSKLGLMLGGEADKEVSDNEPTLLCLTESQSQFPSELGVVSSGTKFEKPYPDVDEFWQLETIGITDDPFENDDDKAVELFERTVTHEDDRYQVALPWIEEKHALLPTNYEIAYERLRSLAKRLQANPELLQAYRDILHLQIERGIIEEVPADEVQSENMTHYLPHHPVFKPSSNTTKIRIVFDAAAKKTRQSLSLNECLLRGPVILPDLCQLLMRVRVHEVVVISDIEKAFLQVGLQPRDRDVTRFLWFKDDTNPTLVDNVKGYRYARVNFGVICSPFLLGATIQHHLTRENTSFAESLRDDIYVDNVISGLDNDCKLSTYYRQLKALFQRAGMNVYEFCSNSKRLMDTVPSHDRVRQSDCDVKLLGLKWDSQGDDTLRLCPSSKFTDCTVNPTKRMVLQAIASVFDPLGFFQPILLPAKCFLQKLWEKKFSWDDVIVGDLKDEWNTIQHGLGQIYEHRIPRFVRGVNREWTLAVFSDASARAYSTAVYLRCQQTEGVWACNLIYAKSRLTPTAKKEKRTGGRVTLPRLELLGALIGSRAANFCRDGLKRPNTKIDFFIDSQCVLHWIGRRGLLKRFVANRVEEIQKTKNCEFHYVSTNDNPADYGTRGKHPEELLPCKFWWHGPSWLTQDQSSWPNPRIPPMTDESLRELQDEIKPAFFSHALAVVEARLTKSNFLDADPNRVSSLSKLLRVSAICMKFIKRKVWNKLSHNSQEAKPQLRNLFSAVSDEDVITATEYDLVKQKWIKCVQENHYEDVLCILRGANTEDKRSTQIIMQLGLRLDPSSELIRSHGRFEHSDLSETVRYPILLPKEDRFTTLIVMDVHERVMHSGVSHTLSQIRQEFWIPCGRALVRRVLNKCLPCRRFKTAQPFKLPVMPPWPKERVSRAVPFHATGLDYFGPLTVKVNDENHKMWVCLFTCLSVRAIHLEPVMDFSAQEFLHSLIRFASRRGVPETVISDNAAQFQLVKILGDKAWPKTPTDESVISYSASNGINWNFITELAPWQGGFYERLVGLVKSTLRTSIRRRLLTWTDLVTLLCETEAVVNSRPLSYIGDDVESNFRILRPCDFLNVPTSALNDAPPDGRISVKDLGDAGKRLVSIWRQRCRTLDKLWRHWYEDYLLSLRERRKISHKSGRSDVDRTPLLDQVVLICDSDVPRGRWRLARIVRLIRSQDGRIRAAELLLPNGFRLRRALNQLVPLEVDMGPDVHSDQVAPAQAGDNRQNDDVASTNLEDNEAIEQPVGQAGDRTSRRPSYDDQPRDAVPDVESDEEPFYGFSQEDVQRAIEAIRHIDDLVPSQISENSA